MSQDQPLPQREWYTSLPKVSPRYLAGTCYGDATPGLQPLEDAGWPHLTDEQGTTRYFSPDGRRCVTFHPGEPELIASHLHALWRVWARPAQDAPLAWAAQFTSDTPTEIIGAFNAALATEPGTDAPHEVPHYLSGPGDFEQSLRPLVAAGWEPAHTAHEHCYEAPDGQAAAHCRLGPERATRDSELAHGPTWSVWAQAHAVPRVIWIAAFTCATPAHLVAAFLTSLADPTGLPRDPDDLPAGLRTQVTPR